MQAGAEKYPGSDALTSFCGREESAREFGAELRSILEVMASTGKYWHEWAQLKALLRFRLVQVLQEFHGDVVVDVGPPALVAGETFPEMLERLVQNLESFVDGAPFTIQRLCELLLNPKGTYTNLDKLALALEKLLVVTSTVPASSDPYPLLIVHAVKSVEQAAKELKVDAEVYAMNGLEEADGGRKGHNEVAAIPGDMVSANQGGVVTAIQEDVVDVGRVLDAESAVERVRAVDPSVLHNSIDISALRAPEDDVDMKPISSEEALNGEVGSAVEEAPEKACLGNAGSSMEEAGSEDRRNANMGSSEETAALSGDTHMDNVGISEEERRSKDTNMGNVGIEEEEDLKDTSMSNVGQVGGGAVLEDTSMSIVVPTQEEVGLSEKSLGSTGALEDSGVLQDTVMSKRGDTDMSKSEDVEMGNGS